MLVAFRAVAKQHVAVDALHVHARRGACVCERLGVRGPAARALGSRRRLDLWCNRIDGGLGSFGFGQGALLALRAPIIPGTTLGSTGHETLRE